MKTRLALASAVAAALAVAASAGARPNSTTIDLGAPIAGDTMLVTFEVSGTIPVVPYEYALENTCALKGGHFTLGQHDDILYWSDTDLDGNPDVVMPVYLQTVPVGASCKVSLVRNNTVVKASVSYKVV